MQVSNVMHAENTGRTKSPKIRHLVTIAQHCQAVYWQLKAWFHVKIKLF